MTLHRGRLPTDIQILGIRELTRADLECVRTKRTVSAISKLRDPHHRLARLIATGMRPAQAAAECGFSLARVYVLHADPSFQDLVSVYRKDVHDAYISGEEERYRMANEVNVKALRHINEHFDKADEEGELIPIGRALQVFSDTADRTGLVKKSVQTNINVDFAAKLENARIRSMKVIEGERTYVEGNLVRRI